MSERLMVGEVTVVLAAMDATGWRPAVEGAETTTGANLRAAPSAGGAVVATLRPGVRVVRLGVDEGGWAPVAALGWVSAELLR